MKAEEFLGEEEKNKQYQNFPLLPIGPSSMFAKYVACFFSPLRIQTVHCILTTHISYIIYLLLFLVFFFLFLLVFHSEAKNEFIFRPNFEYISFSIDFIRLLVN